MVVLHPLGRHGLEGAQADRQLDRRDGGAGRTAAGEHLVGEVQPGRRRRHRLGTVGEHGLVALGVGQLGGDVGRQRHGTVAGERGELVDAVGRVEDDRPDPVAALPHLDRQVRAGFEAGARRHLPARAYQGIPATGGGALQQEDLDRPARGLPQLQPGGQHPGGVDHDDVAGTDQPRQVGDRPVLGRLALAARGAHLGAQREPLGRVPLGVEVVVHRFRERARPVDLVHDRVLGGVGRGPDVGPRGRDQRAVAHLVRRRDAVVAADHAAAPEHPVAVVVGRLHVRAEGVEVEPQRVGRLHLDVDQAAAALALLLEERRADERGISHVREVGLRRGERASRGDGGIAEDLLAVAPQVALLRKSLQHHPDVAGVVLPVGERVQLRVGLLRQVGVDGAGRRLDGELLAELRGPARDDVHGARDPAFDQVGRGTLADDDLAHQLRGQQREAGQGRLGRQQPDRGGA